MRKNSTADKLTFNYTIVNLDFNYEPYYWTKISTNQLIQNIIQDYLTNEIATMRNLQVLIIRLMFENTNLHNMIMSEDDDVSQLAIQMLFEDYLDQYNQLCENPRWESLVSDIIKGYKYYITI